jgi:hypothetical protein
MRSTVTSAHWKRLLSCIVAITCVWFVSNAAEPWQVVRVNKISLEGTLKEGTDFEVRVESKKAKESSGNYFGATDQPASVVSEITVKLSGDKISFPKEAFGDLANALLQTLSITSQPSGEVRLRFSGGEGATGYEAEYFIESKRLVKRTVSYFENSGAGEKSRVVKTTNF